MSDSVFVNNPDDNILNLLGSLESLEISLGALAEPVNHSQKGRATGVVSCLIMPQSYRREHALNWIGRTNVRPVFGRKIIKRQRCFTKEYSQHR